LHTASVAESEWATSIGPGTCDLAPGHAVILYTRADD